MVSVRSVCSVAVLLVAMCVIVRADVYSSIVSHAKQAANGAAIPSAGGAHAWRGGAIPYSWGGGHGGAPGPSTGTCVGYTGSIKPCPATHTVGVDCSGFARWMYALAFGRDRIGGGTAQSQYNAGTKTSSPVPGDLVFFGSSSSSIVHVGVVVGNDLMINAPHTGAFVRQDRISTHGTAWHGYAHYK